MDFNAVLNNIKTKGIRETLEIRRIRKMDRENNSKSYKILLITNRNSDNVGDQVIEACDISLIKTIMKNVGIRKYTIKSVDAGIISENYVETRDESLIKKAYEQIERSDVIIFGGAPMFNYTYQIFSERTVKIVEIAKKYNKPVLFSSIGVEGYDENNKKCMRLKEALNFDNVKLLTTRDDIVSLKAFRDDITYKVADPAVFSGKTFKKFIKSSKGDKKTIGIFVLRSNGFKDNGYNLNRSQQLEMWAKMKELLEGQGYNVKMMTSGNFGDEAILDHLVRKFGVEARQTVFNMSTPEKLVEEISKCDLIISPRLHPSIIAYAIGIPSIGVVYNSKVEEFYKNIKYDNRIFHVEDSVEDILIKVEEALVNGVTQEKEYLMSIYVSLFNAMNESIGDTNIEPYTYDRVIDEMAEYSGTSTAEYERKLVRRSRRLYHTYNKMFEENAELKAKSKK